MAPISAEIRVQGAGLGAAPAGTAEDVRAKTSVKLGERVLCLGECVLLVNVCCVE